MSEPHTHDLGTPHVEPHHFEPQRVDPGSVEIEHLHFVYPDGTEALRGIDLAIEPSAKVALVGPNGAGKSTLMLHLNGIHEPSHGTVTVAGIRVQRSTVRQVRAIVGLVFQDPDDQLFSPTVYEDVAFGPLHMGMEPSEIHHRVESALSAVGMTGMGRRMPHRLSLGQRKRVAIATVLSMSPRILVFDEPTAGLDPRGRRELIELLSGLDQTLIISTHDLAFVRQAFERTVIIDGGRVAADGPTGDLLDDQELLAAHGLDG
jgi:cobalt transport protein ATP-binding subunit